MGTEKNAFSNMVSTLQVQNETLLLVFRLLIDLIFSVGFLRISFVDNFLLLSY